MLQIYCHSNGLSTYWFLWLQHVNLVHDCSAWLGNALSSFVTPNLKKDSLQMTMFLISVLPTDQCHEEAVI